MIKVESNRPLPVKFPFEQMQIGDSFMVPEGVTRAAVSVAAWRYGKAHGKKFTVRKTPEGFCCWRVKLDGKLP
jgi:hypothetical protein